MAFVFSGWQQGIEPWRFNLPTAQRQPQPDARAHTVFDRTLLRARRDGVDEALPARRDLGRPGLAGARRACRRA